MSNNGFNIVKGVLIKYTGADKDVVIPDEVKKISKRAFLGCSELTSVKIGSGVKKIGEWAFKDCKNIKEVTIENGEIGKYAFYECTGLTSVKIGNGVTKIGESAFSDCKNLKEVTIENGEIGKWAFHECIGLTSVKVGNGIKKIDKFAFSKCTNLKEVTIESGKIKEYAFSNCKIDKAVIESKNVGNLMAEIKTLVLKKSVKKFDMVNFMKCKEVYCEAKKKPFGWKWSYTKKYHETMMSGGYYATVNWGVDISKV